MFYYYRKSDVYIKIIYEKNYVYLYNEIIICLTGHLNGLFVFFLISLSSVFKNKNKQKMIIVLITADDVQI